MKNLVKNTALVLGLAMVALTSCKKETIEPNGDVTVPCMENGSTVFVEAGEAINGVVYNDGDTFVETNVGGCDSIVTVSVCTPTNKDIVAWDLCDFDHFSGTYHMGSDVIDIETDPGYFNSNNIVSPYAVELFKLDFKENSVSNLSEYSNVEITFRTSKSTNVVVSNLKATVQFTDGTETSIPLTYQAGTVVFASGLSNVADFQVEWTQTGSGEVNVDLFGMTGDICE